MGHARLSAGLPGSISLSGTLNWTGTGATVIGTTRTVSVAAGNSGQIKFQSLTIGATGTMKYSQNAGAFTTITEGLIVTFAHNDTLAIEAITLTAAETDTVQLLDVTKNTVITTAQIDRIT